MKTKKINSQFIFSKNNIVLINNSREKDKWHPINFQWKPIFELKKEINSI